MRCIRTGGTDQKLRIQVFRTGVFDRSRLPVDSILQGDCLEILKALPSSSVDLVFADPPYNLQLSQTLLRPDSSVVEGVDEDWDRFTDFAAYDAFSKAWLQECRRVLKPTGTLWVIGSYHNIFRLGTQLQDLGYWILNDVVWNKNNPTPNFRGRRFTNAHETLIWAAKEESAKRYTFNYEALKAGNDDSQMRSDWRIPICSGKERAKNDAGKKAHPTQKPLLLLQRILLSSSNVGDVVLDPFFGSGTTGVAARTLGRSFIGVEREDAYVALAQRRIEAAETLSDDLLKSVPSKREEPRVAFAALVAAGLVASGDSLWSAKRKHHARVRPDGQLTVDGLVGSIHKMGALLQGLPACNGWSFWFIEKEGAFISIDALRTQARQAIAA